MSMRRGGRWKSVRRGIRRPYGVARSDPLPAGERAFLSRNSGYRADLPREGELVIGLRVDHALRGPQDLELTLGVGLADIAGLDETVVRGELDGAERGGDCIERHRVSADLGRIEALGLQIGRAHV